MGDLIAGRAALVELLDSDAVPGEPTTRMGEACLSMV